MGFNSRTESDVMVYWTESNASGELKVFKLCTSDPETFSCWCRTPSGTRSSRTLSGEISESEKVI